PPRQIQGQNPPEERPVRPSAHRKSSALLFPSPEHPQAVSSFLLRGQECQEAPDSPPFLWRSLCRHTELRRKPSGNPSGSGNPYSCAAPIRRCSDRRKPHVPDGIHS